MSGANVACLFGALTLGRGAWAMSYDWQVTLVAALMGSLLGAALGTLADPHQ